MADLEHPTGGNAHRQRHVARRGAAQPAPMAMSSRPPASIRGAPSAATSACRWRSWASPRRSRTSASATCWNWSNWTGSRRNIPGSCRAGMQQRASIARALAFDADILLMDEPFGALDEIVRDHLNEQLLTLWGRTGKTIAFVTHSIPEAVYLSTRIVVMSPAPGPHRGRDRQPPAPGAPARHPRQPRIHRDRPPRPRRPARRDGGG